jgi:cupin fold WbuC family metalloprotein
MEAIHSKINSELLHIVVRKNDLTPGRTEVVPDTNFIQCALLNMSEGKTFKPHKHIWKERKRKVIAQESWIVIQGSVRCIFYDIDDQIIATPILYPGDASFTLQGGHTYEILEDNTLVYEYKTGPYEGQELDKMFI